MERYFVEEKPIWFYFWQKIIHFIFVIRISLPDYWPAIGQYDPDWDAELLELIQIYRFVPIDKYQATLGQNIIWVRNHPYGSFTLDGHSKYRPKRLTKFKARLRYRADVELNKGKIK